MNYTEEERRRLLDYLLENPQHVLAAFLRGHGMPVSLTKADTRERLEAMLASRQLRYADVVAFLDEIGPWNAQHVRLLKGPARDVSEWRDARFVEQRAAGTPAEGRLLNRVNYILPGQLRVSSIEHSASRLRVTAIGRRDTKERREELDREEEGDDGEVVELRAWVTEVSRAIIAFEWDLDANVALVQVAQLAAHDDYDDAIDNFTAMLRHFVNLDEFIAIDLRKAIRKFHELEEAGTAPVRSQAYQYESPGGRRLEGRSYHGKGTLLGESHFDDAMKNVRAGGVGRMGNLYWQPKAATPIVDKAVHFHIIAASNRVVFPTANGEEVVRHVVNGVRAHCI